MFTTFIVQPIFNALTLIYALIPGHNFGIAIIIFTILVRFVMYPLLKKQLRHTKAMRELQPEIKKIKEKTKGNRQQESLLTMELYKEREIKPLSFIGLMVIQIIIFLALFQGLTRVVNDPTEIYNFSYSSIQNLPAMQELNNDITIFDNTLLGVVDLSRAAVSSEGFYFAAFLLVLGSSIIQYFQIKQTMPSDKQARKLRQILKEANSGGRQADSTEVNAAMSRNMSYILPVFIFVVTIGFPAALSLYWFVSGLVAYMQQTYLLKQEEYALTGPTAEVVSKKPLKDSGVKVTVLSEQDTKSQTSTKPKTNKPKSSKNKKRRRK